MKKPKRSLHPVTITVIVVLSGIFARFFGIPFLDLMELKTIDLRFASRGAVAPQPPVVLATIDEKSIAREGKWIWPRSKFALLTRKLSEAGTRVIAYDVGFLERDDDDRRMVRTIEQFRRWMAESNLGGEDLEPFLGRLAKEADNDRMLAEAIRSSSAKVVLGYFFQMEFEETQHLTEAEIARHIRNVSGSKFSFEHYTSPEAQEVNLAEAYHPQSNVDIIAESTDYAGYFNMFPDPDGSVRWINAVLRCNDVLYAPLSLMAVSAFLDEPLSVRVAEYGIDRLLVGDRSIPVDEFGRVLINYRGPEDTFLHIPVTDILNDRVPPEALQDKIVLVGATAVGIYDLRVTPFGNIFPGLEIHANIIDSVLAGDFLRQPAWIAFFDVLAILAAGLILGVALPRAGVISGSAVAVVLFAGYILLAQYLFNIRGLILNLIYPLSVIAVLYVGITVYRYFVETKQRRFIRDAFSTYLAPSVVRQLIESPEKLELGGEERVITAFFSDVQGFTSIAEKLAPPELVEMLNEFLTEMTDIILRHMGTVDKFEGDAIIAFFGAPNDLPNQALSACAASIEMQARLVELRRIWREAGKPELRMRIGLHTGQAVVGNMGSKNRMDYTMMGDTVNTAARLEGVNKVYGTYLLIGDRTAAEAGPELMTREIDTIQVMGRVAPITVHELLGYRKDMDESTRETVARYLSGLAAYRKREWQAAIGHFEEALAMTPDDAPSRTMVDRCRTYLDTPPSEDWNGAFGMTTK